MGTEKVVENVYSQPKPLVDADQYVEIKAQATIKDEDGTIQGYQSASFWVQLGKDLDSAVKLSSKDLVFAEYLKGGKIDLQAIMRRHLEAGSDMEALSETIALGQSAGRVVNVEKEFLNDFDSKSKEEQDALIKALLEKTRGGK